MSLHDAGSVLDALLADVGRRAERRQVRAHERYEVHEDARHREGERHPAVTGLQSGATATRSRTTSHTQM